MMEFHGFCIAKSPCETPEIPRPIIHGTTGATVPRKGVAARGAPEGAREAGLINLGHHTGQIAQPGQRPQERVDAGKHDP